MQEELVTFETAKLARAKGFDEPCAYVYRVQDGEAKLVLDLLARPLPLSIPTTIKESMARTREEDPTTNSNLPEYIIACPTQDLLERWLREKHGIQATAYPHSNGTWTYGLFQLGEEVEHSVLPAEVDWKSKRSIESSHELAREGALLHALKLI